MALRPHIGLSYLEVYRHMTPRDVSVLYDGVLKALPKDKDTSFNGPMEV